MLQYATLQEAWGESMPPVRRRKKVPKGPKDSNENPYRPYSEDREFRAVSGLDDYQPWADYTKEDTQRSDEPLPGLDGPARRYPEKVEIHDLEHGPVVDTPPVKKYGDEYVGGPSGFTVGRLDNADYPVYGKPVSHDAGYDVALYVFSGILLILLLEQFVQMGATLGKNAH